MPEIIHSPETVAKVHVTNDMHVQAHRGGGGIAPTHLQAGNRRWVVSTILRMLYPRKKKNPTAIVQGDECASGPLWTEQKIYHLGSDPRTVQTVASRYTD